MRARIAICTALAALAAALAVPAIAAAHAVLESSQPGRGAALERSPEEVSVRFNEPVEATFGGVRVYDREGERVDDGETFRPDDRSDSVGVHLPAGLPDGIYTATYRVVSADSHPISGGFTFTVGDPGAAPELGVADLIDDAGAGTGADVGLGAAKFLTYVATALLVGGLAFLIWVWGPALATAASGAGRWLNAASAFALRMRKLLVFALIAAALGSIAGIVFQGAVVTGGGLAEGLKPSVIGDVLGTRFGTIWGIRLLDIVLLAPILLVPAFGIRYRLMQPVELGATGAATVDPLPRSALAVVALGLGAGFLVLAPGLAGHPGVTDPRWASLLASFAHVLAFSAWAGGLAILVFAVPAATKVLEGGEKTRLLAGLVDRFSVLALVAVGVLLASGVIQAILQLESWSELVETGYGRAILAKAALLAVLIGLGAINRQRNRPRLDELARSGTEAPGGAGRLLRRTMRAEVALIGGVLAVTALLTLLSPSSSGESAGPFSASAELGPAQLELTVDPATAGPNEIHLYLFDREDGSQYDAAKEVKLTAELPASEIGPLTEDVTKSGPGHYVVRDAQLGVAGDWTLDLSARVSAFEQFETEIEVPIR